MGFAHRCNGRESINETAIFVSSKADCPVADSALESLMARGSFRIVESSHSLAEVEQVSKLVCNIVAARWFCLDRGQVGLSSGRSQKQRWGIRSMCGILWCGHDELAGSEAIAKRVPVAH